VCSTASLLCWWVTPAPARPQCVRCSLSCAARNCTSLTATNTQRPRTFLEASGLSGLSVHSSCVVPPCMVASMHAGSVGAFLWTGICNHVSPTAMNVNCDWPVVHVIPQWLPAYITILLRLRPHPMKGGFGSCMSHQMLPANAADAGSLTAGQGIRHRHKHVTTWP